ncbi:MAG: ATP-binding cassette domain-containing protein [Chitinophagales bacterium]
MMGPDPPPGTPGRGSCVSLTVPQESGGEAWAVAEARRLLERVGLSGREEELARNLPYGDQRRLEIARALAARPELLLLDGRPPG